MNAWVDELQELITRLTEIEEEARVSVLESYKLRRQVAELEAQKKQLEVDVAALSGNAEVHARFIRPNHKHRVGWTYEFDEEVLFGRSDTDLERIARIVSYRAQQMIFESTKKEMLQALKGDAKGAGE